MIRADIVTRGRSALTPWKEATDFTRMFLILEWSGEMGGLTIYEMSVILFPDEIAQNGAPRSRAINKTKNLRQRVRHHKVNDMLVPFAMRKVVQLSKGTRTEWLTLNIKTKEDWEKVCKRMSTVILGYEKTMEKFGKVVELGSVERSTRAVKYFTRVREALKAASEKPQIKVPKKKKRSRK